MRGKWETKRQFGATSHTARFEFTSFRMFVLGSGLHRAEV